MSANISWASHSSQFDSSAYPSSSNSSIPKLDEGGWTRTIMNTPQTNPASWPQLGTNNSEHDPSLGVGMSQVQLQNTSTKIEDTGWGGGGGQPPPPKDPDKLGTAGWGRLPPDNPTSSPSGWGAPSPAPTGWGQHQPPSTVDNGTAVWGNSSSSSSSSMAQPTGWGHQIPHSNDSPAVSNGGSAGNGWGSIESSSNSTVPCTTPVQENSQNGSQQLPNSTITANTTSSNIQQSNQNVSWAKAASTNVQPSEPSTTSEGGDSEKLENPTSTSSESPAQQTTPVPDAPDPVLQLVNSHEGWGKKPIQQGTSWNISDNAPANPARQQYTVSNGTEAWGKPSSGQMPPPTGNWGDNGASKIPPQQPPTNRTNNFPTTPGGWGAAGPGPMQNTPRPPFPGGSTSGASSGWGEQRPNQQATAGPGRWNDPSNQNQTPVSPNGWNSTPVAQKPMPGNWGNPQEQAPTPGWSGAPPRFAQPNPGGWNNQMGQPPQRPEQPANWNQPMDKVRRPVDDGTSAWGNPDTYNKVNLWDKRGGGPPPATTESVPTSTQNLNNDSAAKGWGSNSLPPSNQPSSPKGWPDISPTRSNKVDTGVSAWGAKPMPSSDNSNVNKSNWNSKGNTPNNWSQTNKSGSGWGQDSSSQWGQGDSSGWNQQFGKVGIVIH